MSTTLTGTLHVSVIDSDLANGEPRVKCGCPVALALLRTVPGITGIAVGYEIVRWSISGETQYEAVLPSDAQAFITEFDNPKDRHLAKPIEFDLEYGICQEDH